MGTSEPTPKCEDCGTMNQAAKVEQAPCPFEMETHGRIVMAWLCRRCWRDRVDDAAAARQ